MLMLQVKHRVVAKCGTEPRHKVEEQKLLAAPGILQHRSEYHQGVHIEEEMPEAAVHEHMGQELPGLEKWRIKGEQRESFIHRIAYDICSHQDYRIDDDQVFYDRSHQGPESGPAVLVVIHNFLSRSSGVMRAKTFRPSAVAEGNLHAQSWEVNNRASASVRAPSCIFAADFAILAAIADL